MEFSLMLVFTLRRNYSRTAPERSPFARDAAVPTTRFASALVAYCVVATFVTWLLPLAVVLIELARESPT